MATSAKGTTPATATVPQLKLLVDKGSRRVLYAEARKDVVDFLIGLLRVPTGLAARVLANKAVEAPGSLGALYAGVRSLEDAFFLSASPDRDKLLSPTLPSAALQLLPADSLPAPAPTPPAKRYFRCDGNTMPCRGNPTNVTDVSGLPCPACRQPMTMEMRWNPGEAQGKLAQEAAGEGDGGYVTDLMTYLVMDDLTVEPMSTISVITLLKKFEVKDCSTLEELTVDLGPEESVMLLKSSLVSRTTLTDVFSSLFSREVKVSFLLILDDDTMDDTSDPVFERAGAPPEDPKFLAEPNEDFDYSGEFDFDDDSRQNFEQEYDSNGYGENFDE